MKKKYLLIFVFIVISVFVLIQCTTAISATNSPTTSSNSNSSTNSSTTDGAALLSQRCGTCHSAQRSVSQNQTRDGWTQIVDNMIQRGASLTATERTVLIDYLAANYGR